MPDRYRGTQNFNCCLGLSAIQLAPADKSVDASADNLTVADSGASGITIRSGTSNDGSLFFSDGTSGADEYRGWVQYNHSSNYLTFATDANERMRINSSGNVGVGTNAPVATAAAYDSATLHLHQTDSSSAGSQIHLTNGATGAAAGNGVHISMWSDDDLYITNQESDGQIKFASGGNSDVLVIDSDGKVGIGTSTPASYYADFLVVDIGSASQSGITIVSDSDKQGMLAFADGTSGTENYRGYINYNHNTDTLLIANDADASARLSITSDKVMVECDLKPGTNGTLDLGASGAKWDDIYATNGTIQTSDRNEKENITATDLGLAFVDKLTPVSFKRKGKTRTHYGLVAQDVETVITDLGKTTTQFAPLIKDTLDDGTERYGLRYAEFVAPLIKAVQELSAKVAALEAK